MLYWMIFHVFEETFETKIKRKAHLQNCVPLISLIKCDVNLKFQLNALFNAIHWKRFLMFDQQNFLSGYFHFTTKRID